jgi:hypothetical protein
MSNRAEGFQAKSFTIRIAGQEVHKVSCWVAGKLCVCSPEFNSKGAADAYAVMVNSGRRAPEFSAT